MSDGKRRLAWEQDRDGAADLIGGMIAKLEATIGARLQRIEQSVSGLESEHQSVARQVAGLMSHAGMVGDGRTNLGEQESARAVDQPWQCRKCGSLLGYYDPDEDVMRVRYRDHLMHVQIGPGGWITTPCRSCAEHNTVRYAPSTEPGVAEVVDGTITLGSDDLIRLLEEANNDPSGLVRVAVENRGE